MEQLAQLVAVYIYRKQLHYVVLGSSQLAGSESVDQHSPTLLP